MWPSLFREVETMLARVKTAMRIGTTIYDQELLELIASALADIQHAGAVITYTPVETEGTVTDYTVDDPLTRTAVVTYCRMMFGSPDDFDRLKAAYDMQKGQMRESRAYGMEVLPGVG